MYWTRNNPIDLPEEIVKRFENKVMAITGYEVDQVVHTGPQNGTSTTNTSLGGFSCYPSCEEGDVSVPEYNAYNHHYFGWLTGKDAKLVERPSRDNVPNPTNPFFESEASHVYPPQSCLENPGGEFRKIILRISSDIISCTPTTWYVADADRYAQWRRFVDESHGI